MIDWIDVDNELVIIEHCQALLDNYKYRWSMDWVKMFVGIEYSKKVLDCRGWDDRLGKLNFNN